MAIKLRDRAYISDVLSASDIGKEFTIAGWVDSIRVHGRLVFIMLRDRSGKMQVVVKKNVSEQAWRVARKLSPESVIAVRGILSESKTVHGGREIVAKEIVVLSRASPLPIDIREPEKTVLAKRLNWRYLDLRNPRIMKIFIIESEVVVSMVKWFEEHGFINIFTPKIVGTATEGGAEVFGIEYFGKPAFLAQSPQLYKQMGVIAGLEKVFEIGPAFRAEPHHTTRHLTEYTSVDFEMGFIDSYEDVMDTLELLLLDVLRQVIDRYKGEIEELFPDARIALPAKIPRISIKDAYRLLRESGYEVEEGEDLGSDGERALGSIIEREYNSPLVFVTEYPWNARPFYTMRKDNEPEYTWSFDLLYGGLEIATGGQREHRYEKLVEQLHERGLNPESFKWYLEMFRYGAPPHGGAGIGLERVVMQLLGLRNIREARLLPRDPERLTP